jgi:hypothetical protein
MSLERVTRWALVAKLPDSTFSSALIAKIAKRTVETSERHA